MKTLSLFLALILASTSFAFLTPTGGGGGGTPGGSNTNVQYNNSGAFGGFGAWDGTTLSFGGGADKGIFLNSDGSQGSGATVNGNSWCDVSGSIAQCTSAHGIAHGYSSTASQYGICFGAYSSCNIRAVGIGAGVSASSYYSSVIGAGGTDADAPMGFTAASSQNGAENLFSVIPDSTTKNFPRALIAPHTVADDGVSALQVGGSGIMRLVPQANGVTPTCNAGMSGALSETSAFVLCVCNGSLWKSVAVLATTCTF